MAGLDRFRDAQADLHAGFTSALRELQAGRKTGPWIWYVFPQLAGLGRSATAVATALSATEPAPRFEPMADHAHAILTAAVAGGYDRCAFTEEHLRRSRSSSPGPG